MDKFVCVRLVQANALDLTLFQFDYDLTFAVFFMNADKTIYGRYGTRSERKDATKDISIESFREALAAALALHKHYPANKTSLAGKQPRLTQFKTPDDFPSLAGKYKPTLNYEGKVVQSCMHCHQVRDAERRFLRDERSRFPTTRFIHTRCRTPSAFHSIRKRKPKSKTSRQGRLRKRPDSKLPMRLSRSKTSR